MVLNEAKGEVLKDKIYVPAIKTADAELKAYANLDSDVKNRILPLFELTKSRRHKKTNPDGDVYKKVSSIKTLLEDRPFILDLCSHSHQINKQIESLMIEDEGYQNWVDFIKSCGFVNVIPSVILDGEADIKNIVSQAKQLEKSYNMICLRIGFYDLNDNEFFADDIDDFVAPIFEELSNIQNCLIIFDGEFIPKGMAPQFVKNIEYLAKEIDDLGLGKPAAYIPLGSAFPQMVARDGYGNDAIGEFPMEEWITYESLHKNAAVSPLLYGDYASIHPISYDAKGYNWVPRVDAPLEQKYIYHRYRRDVGGYDVAAKHMLADPRYVSCGSWGDEQITVAAARGDVGRSPASWISVRSNIHITKRYQLLSS